MADNDMNEEMEDDQRVEISVKDLRALRNIAKEQPDTNSRLQAAERELAFAKAKIDLTDPKMGYFIKGYEGDLEPEKIREAAKEAGFLTETQQISPQEMAGHQQMGAAAAGANESGDTDLAQAISEAKNPEEVMRIMVAAGRPTSWNRPSDR